jgi:hypothetical protein
MNAYCLQECLLTGGKPTAQSKVYCLYEDHCLRPTSYTMAYCLQERPTS